MKFVIIFKKILFQDINSRNENIEIVKINSLNV